MKVPGIKIQLIHIDGPFKGQIAEFLNPVITLGRHPDCDVVFPADLLGVSRRHAEIRREGNRFLLRDTSTNGTLVNGKQQAETFLKNGDVLILGTGGPKISFLSTILETNVELPAPGAPAAGSTPPGPAAVPPRSEPVAAPPPPRAAFPQPEPRREAPPSVPAAPSGVIASVQKPLVIQYGVMLKAFKSLPVTIGRGADCDFVLDAPSILEHHAQILFTQGEYWVKDLTGRNLLSVNLTPVQAQAPLQPDSHLSLAPNGPKFQFLGEGRLVEIESAPQQADPSPGTSRAATQEAPTDKKGGLFKRIFGKD